MIDIGRFNQLEVLEVRDNALVLDAGLPAQPLLPIEEIDRRCQPGDKVDAFVYPDAGGNLVATTRQPRAEMGQVAWLEVVAVNELGAFADWGMPKDLFIPFAEQQHPLRKGQQVLLRVYMDNQGRIAGSSRIDHWIKDDASGFRPGEQVSLIIADRTELGFKAVINHRSWGLLYGNELFKTLRKGQAVTGYIKQIRADQKIDLALEKPGFSKSRIETLGEQIIEQLTANGGQLPLTDKSPPEAIYTAFGVSKKVFKQAIGALYKQKRISLASDAIRIAKE